MMISGRSPTVGLLDVESFDQPEVHVGDVVVTAGTRVRSVSSSAAGSESEPSNSERLARRSAEQRRPVRSPVSETFDTGE